MIACRAGFAYIRAVRNEPFDFVGHDRKVRTLLAVASAETVEGSASGDRDDIAGAQRGAQGFDMASVHRYRDPGIAVVDVAFARVAGGAATQAQAEGIRRTLATGNDPGFVLEIADDEGSLHVRDLPLCGGPITRHDPHRGVDMGGGHGTFHLVLRCGFATWRTVPEIYAALLAGWHAEMASAPAGFARADPEVLVGAGWTVLTVHSDPDVEILELVRAVEVLEWADPAPWHVKPDAITVWRTAFDSVPFPENVNSTDADAFAHVRARVAVRGNVEIVGTAMEDEVLAWVRGRLPPGPPLRTEPLPPPQAGIVRVPGAPVVAGGHFDPEDPGDVWAAYAVASSIVRTAGGGSVEIDPDPVAPRWFAVPDGPVAPHVIEMEIASLRLGGDAEIPERIELPPTIARVAGRDAFAPRRDPAALRRLASTCSLLLPADGDTASPPARA